MLVPTLRNNRRLYVTLKIGNKRFGFAIDRLVVSVFLGFNYKDIRRVVHKNYVLHNNNISNLDVLLW